MFNTRLLSRLSFSDSGDVAFWHYVTVDNPLEEGYFNAAFQLLQENDLMVAIINQPGRVGITAFLTVTESSRDCVKVRPQSVGMYKQLMMKEKEDEKAE
jgi:hypothetical protein